MRCRYCRAAELRRSRRRWYDHLRCLLFKQMPYRCRSCRVRQWYRDVDIAG